MMMMNKLANSKISLMQTNNNNNNKSITCYCNDNNQCYNSSQCITDTFCMAKRIRLLKENTNKTKLIYYCGEYKQASLRAGIINFRDCNIYTKNIKDLSIARESSEYCCNTYNECNRKLVPINSVFDLSYLYDEQQQQQQLENTNNNNNSTNKPLDLSFINLVLLSSLLFLLLIAIVTIIILLIVYKKRKLNNNTNENKKLPTYETHPFIDTKNLNYKSTSLFEKFKIKLFGNNINSKEKVLLKLNSPLSLIQNDDSLLLSNNNQPYYISNLVVSSINNNNNQVQTPTTQSSTISTNISDSQKSSLIDQYIISSGRLYPQNGIISDSGSGSGNPICVPRTIARDIKLLETVGIGRYGEVHRGKWTGEEYVAVKTFNSAEENSWKNEINIYLTQCLRDENILGFIAADIIDTGFSTQLWIITEFHENKSLYDYLQLNTIDLITLLNMSLSIIKGLKHLHMSIKGCTGKLALAHCDLKSKNILVKSNLTCCIGDLGLAIAGDIDGNIEQSNVIRTGTKRYMAPEILLKTINSSKIEAYQKADMYSLSLVFWELLNRCKLNINDYYVNDYVPPYNEHLPIDPNEILVKKVVCELKLRPGINQLWKSHRIIDEYTALIEELWNENPDARLNAFRVKKSIDKFINDLLNDN